MACMLIIRAASAAALVVGTSAFAQEAQYGTAKEAQAMLANAAAAVKADKKAALVMFNNGEVGFKVSRLISVLLRSQRWPVRGCYSLIDGYGYQSPQGPHRKCIRPRTIRSGAEAGRRGERGHLYVSKARRGQDAGSESNIHHEGRGSRLRCWVLQINTRAGSLAVRRLLYPPRSGRIRWVGRYASLATFGGTSVELAATSMS